MADLTLPYRRALLMRAVATNVVVADLEDDFHRFRVALTHHDGHVERVDGEALRYPWSTCVDSTESLRALEGTPLSHRMTAAAAHTNPRTHCTHLFDLAGLAITHAARATQGEHPTPAPEHRAGPERRYDVELWPRVDGRSTAVLRRDGERYVDWHLDGGVLVEPAPYTEGPWRGGFLRWADATLPPDQAEAAIVLRRACDIGLGRGMDLEAHDTAAELLVYTDGACYTMRRGVAEHARRIRGTIRDFGTDADALLSDMDKADVDEVDVDELDPNGTDAAG